MIGLEYQFIIRSYGDIEEYIGRVNLLQWRIQSAKPAREAKMLIANGVKALGG